MRLTRLLFVNAWRNSRANVTAYGASLRAGSSPARSTSQAIFVGGWALQQLWLFWVASLLGAAIAGFVYPALFSEEA